MSLRTALTVKCLATCHRNVCGQKQRRDPTTLICKVDEQLIRQHAAEGYCPMGMYPDPGWGDRLAWLLGKLRVTAFWMQFRRRVLRQVKRRGCGGCKKRQMLLNKLGKLVTKG